MWLIFSANFSSKGVIHSYKIKLLSSFSFAATIEFASKFLKLCWNDRLFHRVQWCIKRHQKKLVPNFIDFPSKAEKGCPSKLTYINLGFPVEASFLSRVDKSKVIELLSCGSGNNVGTGYRTYLQRETISKFFNMSQASRRKIFLWKRNAINHLPTIEHCPTEKKIQHKWPKR